MNISSIAADLHWHDGLGEAVTSPRVNFVENVSHYRVFCIFNVLSFCYDTIRFRSWSIQNWFTFSSSSPTSVLHTFWRRAQLLPPSSWLCLLGVFYSFLVGFFGCQNSFRVLIPTFGENLCRNCWYQYPAHVWVSYKKFWREDEFCSQTVSLKFSHFCKIKSAKNYNSSFFT